MRHYNRQVKIYTRTGDTGETSLIDSSRVSKAEARVDAYGEVDELNACLGLVLGGRVDPELADFLVYTPLQRRRLVLAVFASGLVGLTIDSVIFLYLAFGNLDFVTGQIVGKSLMIIIALPAIIWIRQRDEKLGILPA